MASKENSGGAQKGKADAEKTVGTFLEAKEIKKLIGILSAAGGLELELEQGGNRLRIRMPDSGTKTELVQVPSPYPAMGFPAQPQPGMAPGAVAPQAAGSGSGESELPEGADYMKSPMVGTFYRAPSPEADVFVHAGDRVDEDTTLCIIEAMKVMNEIKAEQSAEVVKILVENGDPVEFGQPLFILKPL